jgi:hypothetical protein
MPWFRHPNPKKLAADNDMHGLVNCVTKENEAIAREAASLLAGLVDDFDNAPGTHEVLVDLEMDAGPMAKHALGCVLRHDFGHNSRVKSSAATALYRIHAVDELKRVIEELRASEHQGQMLHATLSQVLLGAATRADDVAMVEFLLVNGQYQDPGEVAVAYELLRSRGGAAAADKVANDPAVFSEVAKEAASLRPS